MYLHKAINFRYKKFFKKNPFSFEYNAKKKFILMKKLIIFVKFSITKFLAMEKEKKRKIMIFWAKKKKKLEQKLANVKFKKNIINERCGEELDWRQVFVNRNFCYKNIIIKNLKTSLKKFSLSML